MDGALRDRLVAIVGARHVATAGTVRPATIEQLREVVAACAAAGVRALPPGAHAGSDGVEVDSARLVSVTVDDATPLLRAGGAAPWTAIRDAASKRRLAVAGLPGVAAETVGESVLRGEIAARTLAGVVLLTMSGRLAESGGRTLKDVVGYNVAGLVLGSGARLGTVAGVVLRLEPAGARTPALTGPGPWRDEPAVDVVAALTG